MTGTRAEYGLLYWLMRKIQSDEELELQLIVTGMHLSPEFGLTFKEVEKEFGINKKIEMLLSSDTPVGVSKSIGLAQISFGEAFFELQPDFIIVLGDRYEILAAATAAMIARIPIIHLHGGESTEGAFDEAIRHAVTKMSHLHFTATEAYRRRVIQLGENPSKVFNVGGMGVENIKKLSLMSKKELEASIGCRFAERNLLITFHPVTLEAQTAEQQFQELLDALDELSDTQLIFTKANSDTGGRIINKMIDEYVGRNSCKAVGFESLGQLRYLSCLQYIDAVVGNSSSGISEAPSFKIGTINIGDRQKGRVKADSVIDCEPQKDLILNSISLLYSKSYQEKLLEVINPYEGKELPSEFIVSIIKEQGDSNVLLKKTFYDLETS